jgi:hypothetical protein
MNVERTGKCLRQVEDIRGHLWHRYSIAINQVMEADDFNLTNRNLWFSRFLVCSNPLSRKSWQEPQALEYRIRWEIYIPYAGADEMLLHIYGKFTMGKLKLSLLSESFVLIRHPLSMSRCRSRYEGDLSVFVVSFISSSMG